MIGVSPEFRTMQQLQGVDSPCDDNIVGVQLHTFTRNSNGNGAMLRNVSFSGFIDTGCSEASAINFDDEVII